MGIKSRSSGKEGAVLGVILIVMLMISILTLSLFKLGQHSVREAMFEKKSAQAFWLADAGVRRCVANLNAQKEGGIENAELDVGAFTVTAVDEDETIFHSVGTVMMGGQPVQRKIEVNLKYAASAFEDTLHSASRDGDPSASKVVLSGKSDAGDRVQGIVNVNGKVCLSDEASVEDLGGLYNVLGLVKYSQGLAPDGVVNELTTSASYTPPNLAEMNYAKNNTYDLDDIFLSVGCDASGRLLDSSHPLYDVVAMNAHISGDPTPGDDDYYFLPGASLALGDDQVFYVDGHVWFRDESAAGFTVDGTATIVATKDIHVSGRVVYANDTREPVGENKPDMLALVALGEGLDLATGRPAAGGNIYLGDPNGGELSAAQAFMFANNNFYCHTDSAGEQSEPSVGFEILGNCMAMNQVLFKRDWYTKSESIHFEDESLSGSYADGSTDSTVADSTTDSVAAEAPAVKPVMDDYASVMDYFDALSAYYSSGDSSTTSTDSTTDESFSSSGTTSFSSSASASISASSDGTITSTVETTGNAAAYVSADVTTSGSRMAEMAFVDGAWKWVDSVDGTELTPEEAGAIRHYSMQINYDDRIRDLALRMPGLPRGEGAVIAGYTWKELPAL